MRHKLLVSLSWKKINPPGATAGCSAGLPLQPFSCSDNQPGCHLLLVPSAHRGKNTDDKEYFLLFCPPWWPQSYLNSLCNDAESPTRVTLVAYSSFNFPSHARTLISMCRERIVLNTTIAGIMNIFIAHLSSLNLKSLQVLIAVLTCFYRGCCFSSQSKGPRSLSLIFGQDRSDHKVVQTRWEICLS